MHKKIFLVTLCFILLILNSCTEKRGSFLEGKISKITDKVIVLEDLKYDDYSNRIIKDSKSAKIYYQGIYNKDTVVNGGLNTKNVNIKFSDLKVGDQVSVTILNYENDKENGIIKITNFSIYHKVN